MELLSLVLLIAAEIRPVTLETPEGARQPQIAVRPASPGSTGESVHVVYGTKGAIYLSSSVDSGASFRAPRKIADVGSLSLGMRRGPRVAVAGDSLVVTAIAGEKGGGADGDLLAWRSTDGGATWKAIGSLNAVAGSAREGLHGLAAGTNGELACAWIDLAEDRPRVRLARSSDLGAGWDDELVFDGSERICPCCAPSVAFDGKGGVWVMWRGQDEGNRDMVAAHRAAGASAFTEPVRVGQGHWKIGACPMDGGAIGLAGGRVRTIWRREGGVYRCEPPALERKLGDGEQPCLALAADGEYAAWLAKRGGPLLLLRPGSSEPIRLDEAANDPVLATSADPRSTAFAVWESGPLDAPRIVVAKLSSAPAPR
jgi:hypothetical protein